MTVDRASTAPNQCQGDRTMKFKTAVKSHVRDSQKTDCNQPQSLKKYAIDRKVKQMGSRANIRYKVRWYGYHTLGDAYEPTSNSLQQFSHSNWVRKARPGQLKRKRPNVVIQPHTLALVRREPAVRAIFVSKCKLDKTL